MAKLKKPEESSIFSRLSDFQQGHEWWSSNDQLPYFAASWNAATGRRVSVGDAACVAVRASSAGSGNKNRNAPIETKISIKTAAQDLGFHANSAELFHKNRKSIKTALHRQPPCLAKI